jgi:hypothetical protein
MGRLVPAALVLALALTGCGGEARTTASRQRWQPLRHATLARTEVAAARVGSSIYVIGGFRLTASGPATTAAVERYDTRRERWTRARSMPVPLNHAAATSYRGRLYVAGGYMEGGNPVATLYRYDSRPNRWTQLPSMPTARAALALGAVGGKLYAAGGAASGRALATLEVYDIAGRRWSHAPDLATAREHLAGVAADGFFYALAGRAAGQGNLAVAERFNPRAGRWERLPEMRKPRGGIAAAAIGRRVVVLGGEEAAGTIREVELFDSERRSWSRLPSMRTPRHGLGAAALGHRIYSVEGGPQPGFAFSSALEALDVP